MSEKIISKIHKAGHEKEGSWPPMEPSGEKGFFWVHDVDGECVHLPYPPEPKGNCFGQAPYVIQDSIEPYYHPRLQQTVDSRSKLAMVDKSLGTITMGANEKPSITPQQIRAKIDKELREDRRQAREKAIAAYDSGNLPLSEEMRAKCKQRNEALASQLGIDSFKHNGKRYKLK